MENKAFVGSWITTEEFANKKPFNVFFRQLDCPEYPENMPQNKHILFRKRFFATKFSVAILRISADDYYKLYVNGKFVAQGVAPCYAFKQYYNEIDLTEYLNEGENLIAVHTYYYGVPNRVCVSGDLMHGLIFDLFIDDKLVLSTDETFKCAEHDGYVGTLSNKHKTQFMETYDGRSPYIGFEQSSYNDENWKFAKLKKYCDYALVKQPTETLDVYEIQPKIVQKNGNTIFVDIGREIVGNLVLTAKGKRGDVVIMCYGEELNADGSVMYNLRCGCNYEEKWILSGGENDKLDFWDYKGFRYAEIIMPNGAEILSLEAEVRHYPYKEKRTYEGNDEKERAVFTLCRDTIKYGVQECFIDCPTREKGQYFMDGVYIGLSQAALTDDTAMLRKMIDNAFGSSIIDKCLVADGPNAFMQEIAEAPFLVVCACYAEYAFSNDKTELAENYCRASELLKEIKRRYAREDGLITVYDKWNVVDWPAESRDGYDCDLSQGRKVFETHNVINGYYLEALSCLNAMAKELNEPVDEECERVKKSYIAAFYDEERGLFKDRETSEHCSLMANAIALLVVKTVSERTKNNIIKLIEEKGFATCNIFTSPIVLLALEKLGKHDLVKKLIVDKTNWLNMINEGGTTTFEAFSKFKKANASLFHPVFAFPVLFLTGLNFNKYFDKDLIK